MYTCSAVSTTGASAGGGYKVHKECVKKKRVRGEKSKRAGSRRNRGKLCSNALYFAIENRLKKESQQKRARSQKRKVQEAEDLDPYLPTNALVKILAIRVKDLLSLSLLDQL